MRTSTLALLVLIGCLAAMWPLSKVKLIGPMAVVGFVLGVASTASVVALVG
ncbi:hypothetical protein ACTG9Q_00605 [Actinokineospora sp. 24-640]